MENNISKNLPPFLESKLQGITIFRDKSLVYINTRAKDLLNYNEKTNEDNSLDYLFRKLHPIESDKYEKFKTLIDADTDFEEKIEFRTEIDSKYKWFSIIANSLKYKATRFVILLIDDITKSKEQEILYLENDSRYKNFIEQTSEGISFLEFKKPIDITKPIEEQIKQMYETGYIKECNDALAKMYGLNDRNELIGKKLIDIHGTADNETNIKAYIDFRNNNYNIKNVLTEELNINNRKVYFLNNTVGIINGNLLKGYWGTQIDITEKQRYEKNITAALKISETVHKSGDFSEMYSLIHNIISTLMPAKNLYIAVYNETTDMIEFPYFVDEKDKTAESRKPGSGITEYVLKTGKSLLATPNVIQELRKKGESLSYGAESIDWLGVPLKTNSKTFGIIAVQSYTEGVRYNESDVEILEFVAEQVSMAYERKSSEESLLKSETKNRAILSAIPDLIFVQNYEGVYLEYHARNSDLLLLKPEDFIGKNYKDVLPKNLVKLFTEVIKETIETNEIQLCKYPLEINNELKHFEARFISFDNDKILSTIRDITIQEQMMDELINAKEKAEEMNKIKSNFLANMSHELRTPLHGIIGFAQLLSDEIEDIELKNMSELIHKSANRLLETLNLVLNFSKIDSNKVELNYSEIYMEIFVGEIIDLFKPMAENKNLKLFFEIKNGITTYLTDERILRKILNNLINNSIKFTTKGYVKIGIDKSDDEMIIKVSDSGIGIPEDKFELIFEEFRQESEGLSRNFEGTGLGLTLTKRYVDLLKGEILLESKVGEGTTFTIKLPDMKVKKEIEDEIKNISTNEKLSIIPAPTIKKRLLLVENDKVSAMLVKTYLKYDYELEIVTNGDIALQRAAENEYDAILMDINLGVGLTGLDTAQKIKLLNKYKHVPIIAVTAFAMEKDKEEFLKFGCTHYIAKPFEKSDLLKLLNLIFKNKSDN